MDTATIVGELVRKMVRAFQIDGSGIGFPQAASVPLHPPCLLLLVAAASLLLASHGLRTVLELQVSISLSLSSFLSDVICDLEVEVTIY